MDTLTKNETVEFVCKYCAKAYRKESVLAAHLCEPKRRAQQESEPGVQLGFQSYLKFYEMNQGSAKLKTYADFCKSPYYIAFVKFGRYLRGIRCINPSNYMDWLLRNNKKLDHWCRDQLYEEWLLDYTKKENYLDAFERSLLTMQDWAEENNSDFSHYFLYGNKNKICYDITTARISSWVIFNSKSGLGFLDTINEEQLGIIFPWINPDIWSNIFKKYAADTEHIKQLLEEINL